MLETPLNYDGSFDIAAGKSRKETHWRNRETTWSAFLNKVKETHRTAEKYTEYMSAKKARQDEIKDVGGFVGGYVNGGRRKAENILHRQLVTLDIDFGSMELWDDFKMLYGDAACIYSTHKHSSDHQRLRLIVPLDRPVGSDEYVAIARRIAGDLDINAFDDTTYEPSRLMYWPSTAKDGEYVFEYQDGPWLSADEVLTTYRNWKDASEWPLSDRVDKAIFREIKKQGDPLEKPGIIGAFCRTYTITEAIDLFLPEAYEACDLENRFTYKEGSTAAGLVVYDDKYAYSHHGTDPTSGKLCNAFDLVRLHLYGLQDEDAKEGTPGNRLPSFKAMQEFAAKDPKTRKQLGVERLEEMKSEFGDSWEESEEEGEPDTSWLEKMDVDGKANFLSTINNVKLALDNDPLLKGRFALNKFENREVLLKSPPWRQVDPKLPYMVDKDDAGLRHYMESVYKITGVQKIADGLALTLENNSFHPIRDRLKELEHDGINRVDTVFIDYLGAEDCPYIRAVTRKVLVAAVARVFVPGIKFDTVVSISGKQGEGKSTIIRKLGGKYYSDSFGTVQGKEAFEQIQGVWLVEMAELAGLKKAEAEAIKHFISKQEDRFRVAYGKRVEIFPRQCVFFATTNDWNFLNDPTGNRRFWPVATKHQEPTKDVFDDLTDYEIDQIWAEAVVLFRAGETLYLDKEMEKEALKRQQEHSVVDDRTGVIQEFLNTPVPENWYDLDPFKRRNYYLDPEFRESGTDFRDRISIAEIWCELFGLKQADMNRYNTKDLHNIMRNMPGWEASKYPVDIKNYGRQRVYRRVETGIHEGAIGIHEKNIEKIDKYTKYTPSIHEN